MVHGYDKTQMQENHLKLQEIAWLEYN